MRTTYQKQSPRSVRAILMTAASAFALAAFGFAPSAQAADTQTVKVMGQAAIYGGDKLNARDKAIQDAQRKAVEMAVGAIVSSETVTKNFQLLSDKIFSKSKGFIKSYKVLKEAEDSGVMQVTIEAVVSTENLQSSVDGVINILRAKNMPRVLLLITESNIGNKETAGWWQGGAMDLGVVENTFIHEWGKMGIEFVDRQALQGKIAVGKAMSAEPTPSEIKEFAGDSGAEVVIVGKALANDLGPIMSTQMRSIRGNISLRAISLDNASILATASEAAAVGHIDVATGGTKALEKVTQKAAKTLLTRILDKWQNAAGGMSKVKLVIKGVNKSKLARKLRAVIGNQVRGVQGVRQRGYRKKVLELEVELKGSAETLATELEEKDIGYEVEIEEITANTVVAVLGKKK